MSIIKKKRKKHDKIVFVEQTMLNSIEVNYEKFASVNNVFR